MRLATLPVFALAVLTVQVFAQAKPPSAAASQQQSIQRRAAPSPSELLDVFVETTPYTSLALFREYDRMNKIKLQSPAVLTTRKPGKYNADEARALASGRWRTMVEWRSTCR